MWWCLKSVRTGSDVWTFGCLMFELFAWRKPFFAFVDESSIVQALRNGQRPNLADHVIPRYKGRRLVRASVA